jgi:hypothetical protein
MEELLLYTDQGCCCAKGLGDILPYWTRKLHARTCLPSNQGTRIAATRAERSGEEPDSLPHGSQVEIARRSREMRSMGHGKAWWLAAAVPMHKLLVCVKESDGLLWRELESTKSARAFPSINFVRCTCSTTARDRLRQVGGVQKRGCLTFDNMQAKFASPPFSVYVESSIGTSQCVFSLMIGAWLTLPIDPDGWPSLLVHGAWWLAACGLVDRAELMPCSAGACATSSLNWISRSC